MQARWIGILLSLLAAIVPLTGCAPRPATSATPTVPAQSQANSAVTFTDVTRVAGIQFNHVNGAFGRFYYPETMGSGGGFIDYDRDGRLDVLLVNGDYWPGHTPTGATRPTLALYRNDGDDAFTDVTAQAGLNVSIYGMGVAVGDYDNDGYDDLYITGLKRSLLFHNMKGSRFRDVTPQARVGNEGHWGSSAAWLDYDNDGRLDLFVCNYVLWRPQDDQVCLQGGLPFYCGPLVYKADSCRLFRNLGGGRFQDVTQEAGIHKTTGKSLGVTVWDLEGDGYPEIFVANDLTPNYLFRNNRKGAFREEGLEAGIAYGADGVARSGMGIDIADTKNDGKFAVFISNFAREPNSYFVQESQSLFSDKTYETGMGEPSLQWLGFGLHFLDYDNDGWKDAFVANGHIQPEVARYEPGQMYAQQPLLFHNRGDGNFDEVHKHVGGNLMDSMVGRGAACGDYDNDGDSDILVTTNNGAARLLRNDGGNRANWLTIHLRGSKSNRNGIGAQVKVTAGGITQRDQVRSGSSYLSASDLRLRFGLGSAGQAEHIEIQWPSGIIDRLRGVKSNQILVIDEGKGARGDGKRDQLN